MRISDWSSDGCSSDLAVGAGHQRNGIGPVRQAALTAVAMQYVAIIAEQAQLRVDAPVAVMLRERSAPAFGVGAGLARNGVVRDAVDEEARKSVVEGKSVFVRLEIGGRRIIKIKINKHSKLNVIKTN